MIHFISVKSRCVAVILRLCLCIIAFACLPAPAAAQTTYKYCTVAAGTANLGSQSSLTLATATHEGSGSGGLTCTTTLSLLSTSYIKVRVNSSTFVLTGGPDNQTIPFSISATSGGTAIPAGSEFNFSSLSLLSLFSGPGGSLPLYVKTSLTPALKAGTYTGSVQLNWYFSVCTLGLLVVCDFSESPGFVRPFLTTQLNWGTGAPSTMNITMEVVKDCAINAPDFTFGSAPFTASFREATQTITIRCSAGTAYSVGLNNGANFDTGSRRMRRAGTSDYIRYEIYKLPASNDRWGNVGAERRHSSTAQVNAGTYNGVTLQSYTYGARIDTTQPSPGVGTYLDTILLDVVF